MLKFKLIFTFKFILLLLKIWFCYYSFSLTFCFYLSLKISFACSNTFKFSFRLPILIILLYLKNWNLTTTLILREKVTSSKMFLLETKFKNRLENAIKIKDICNIVMKISVCGGKTWGKLNLCNMHIRKWKVPVVNLNKLYKMVYNQHAKDLFNIYVQVKLLKAPFL